MAVENGLPFKFAAAAAGISNDTFCRWRREKPEFSEAIDEAVAKGILARLEIIGRAAKKDYRAATWWLEHVVPEHFARNRIELKHDVTGTVQNRVVLEPETLAAIAASRIQYERSRSQS